MKLPKNPSLHSHCQCQRKISPQSPRPNPHRQRAKTASCRLSQPRVCNILTSRTCRPGPRRGTATDWRARAGSPDTGSAGCRRRPAWSWAVAGSPGDEPWLLLLLTRPGRPGEVRSKDDGYRSVHQLQVCCIGDCTPEHDDGDEDDDPMTRAYGMDGGYVVSWWVGGYLLRSAAQGWPGVDTVSWGGSSLPRGAFRGKHVFTQAVKPVHFVVWSWVDGSLKVDGVFFGAFLELVGWVFFLSFFYGRAVVDKGIAYRIPSNPSARELRLYWLVWFGFVYLWILLVYICISVDT